MPEPFLTGNKGRHGQRLPAGNEGAGTVIATGDSDMAKALMGQRVACVLAMPSRNTPSPMR